MGEDLKILLGVVGAILAIPAGIFALLKAYLELKRVITEKRNNGSNAPKGDSMNNSHNMDISIKKSKIKGSSVGNVDNSTTIYGDVTVQSNTNPGDAPKESVDDKESIRLKDKYTSLFAEDDKLKTEQIVITKQKNGIVEGTVTLLEEVVGSGPRQHFTYSLKGRFTNKVLTAEYYSNNGDADERGAINLKLIDRDILSGFCSFSKLSAAVDDEIRVSPYVWVSGENKDLMNGTFDFCTQCYTDHKVCCCASEKVDMPVFVNGELAAIRNQLVQKNTEKNSFSKALSDPFQKSAVRQMKREDKKEKDGTLISTKCHFYNAEEQKCRIYEGRPIDCKLFPYDIKLSEEKKEYIIGYYTDLCERSLPDLSTMKKKAHILRPYFFLLYPYLHIITSNEVCQRLNHADFQEIARFKDFVF